MDLRLSTSDGWGPRRAAATGAPQQSWMDGFRAMTSRVRNRTTPTS